MVQQCRKKNIRRSLPDRQPKGRQMTLIAILTLASTILNAVISILTHGDVNAKRDQSRSTD